jgi:hypothetical protein
MVTYNSGDLFADPQKIVIGQKNYLCQLLNVHGAGGIRQTEMHTSEPFLPKSVASEVEVAIENLKRYKTPDFNRIPVELIQAEGNT